MEIPILGILLFIAYFWISIKFGDWIHANMAVKPYSTTLRLGGFPVNDPLTGENEKAV